MTSAQPTIQPTATLDHLTRGEVERGLAVGGQALVEGVLMRGPDRVAMAARRPDGGIALRIEHVPSWSVRVGRIPLLRGVVALVESVHVGMAALQWSASIAEPDGDRKSPQATIGSLLVALLAVVSAFAVFTALPAVVASWTIPAVGPIGRTVVEGVLGIALLVAYIAGVRRHPLVFRTFGYHGAEHKAVSAYESDGPLDPASASRFTTRHERCGTTFMLDVAVLSALMHTVTNVVWPDGPAMVAARLLAIPVVAGVAYEVIRFATRHADRPWARTLTRPGMWLQGLTTAEPDHDQLEVAVVALRAALPRGPSASATSDADG